MTQPSLPQKLAKFSSTKSKRYRTRKTVATYYKIIGKANPVHGLSFVQVRLPSSGSPVKSHIRQY